MSYDFALSVVATFIPTVKVPPASPMPFAEVNFTIASRLATPLVVASFH